MTHWLNARQQADWRAWVQASFLLRHRLEQDLQATHGLSLADYEILVRLSDNEDRRIRMSELATLTLSSRSRLSHQIDRMESIQPDVILSTARYWGRFAGYVLAEPLQIVRQRDGDSEPDPDMERMKSQREWTPEPAEGSKACES